MAKTEGSKRPFKEKIVQIYEAFFRVSHMQGQRKQPAAEGPVQISVLLGAPSLFIEFKIKFHLYKILLLL